MVMVMIGNATFGSQQDVPPQIISNLGPNFENVWSLLSAQINTEQRFITIHGVLFNTLTSDEKICLAQRTMLSIKSDAGYVKHPAEDMYFLGSTSILPQDRHFSAADSLQLLPTHSAAASPQKPKSEPKRATKEQKIPRPPNAFILYRKHWHETVKAQNPPGTHNNILSKILGEQWQKEPETVRDEWKAAAEQKAREHALLYPGYKYQPRKSAEKKRRMTKAKKAAALAATLAQNANQAPTGNQISPPSTNPLIRGFGRSQRPGMQISHRLDLLDSQDYSSLTAAELGDLPWGFLRADHVEATTFTQTGSNGPSINQFFPRMDFAPVGDTFLEIGPQQILCGLGIACLADDDKIKSVAWCPP